MNNQINNTFKIGDKAFVFDQNRRVYAPGNRSSPIYRAHFREVTIDGETSRSWLVGKFKPAKYPKSGESTGLYTAEQVEEQCWINEHRYKISEMVRVCSYRKLREIAEIVGFKP